MRIRMNILYIHWEIEIFKKKYVLSSLKLKNAFKLFLGYFQLYGKSIIRRKWSRYFLSLSNKEERKENIRIIKKKKNLQFSSKYKYQFDSLISQIFTESYEKHFFPENFSLRIKFDFHAGQVLRREKYMFWKNII